MVQSESVGRIRRIALVGPESCGKTELAMKLASHFATEWVPEFLREYFDLKEGKLMAEDTLKIIEGQIAAEKRKMRVARDYLFCDTCPLQSLIYHAFYFGEISAEVELAIAGRSYDMYLLLEPDLPWEADSQRDGVEVRERMFPLFERELLERGLVYRKIRGKGEKRFKLALAELEGNRGS